MPREVSSNLPHLKGRVFTVPTAAEKKAKAEAEAKRARALSAIVSGRLPPLDEPVDVPIPMPKPLVEPVFDPERLAVQSYSAEGGMGFVQGKNFFTSTGKFVRELPESAWYITTPEQEENNRKARARQRQIFGKKAGTPDNAPALPTKVLNALRENGRAAAAEALAE
jgi:hypothetical protein